MGKKVTIRKQGNTLKVFKNGKFAGTSMNLNTNRIVGATKYAPLLRAKRALIKAAK